MKDKKFILEDGDRKQIVQWLREYYFIVTGGKSWNYMSESQREDASTVGNMVSKLGYNAFTEGMDF